jgi:AcrR family transcriptional regulator
MFVSYSVNVVEAAKSTIRAETRQRLVTSAAAVFVEKGFAAASLEEIVARAGYTRGAFHWHFSSKEELLVEVMRQRMEARQALTDEVVAGADGPNAFNRAERKRIGQIPFEDRRGWVLLTMEFWLYAARHPDALVHAARMKADLRAVTARQVQELVHAANVVLPLPVETIASALMALDDGFALQELLDPETITPATLWDVVDVLTQSLVQPASEPRAGLKRNRTSRRQRR